MLKKRKKEPPGKKRRPSAHKTTEKAPKRVVVHKTGSKSVEREVNSRGRLRMTEEQFLRRLKLKSPEDLALDSDLPEIELDLGPFSCQRVFPDHKRPSVVAGQCVRPDLWWVSNSRVFGCSRCTEQDVCPTFKRLYTKEALTNGVQSTEFSNEKYRVAAKYWEITPKILGATQEQLGREITKVSDGEKSLAEKLRQRKKERSEAKKKEKPSRKSEDKKSRLNRLKSKLKLKGK